MRVSYQSDGSSIGTDNCLSGANCGTDLCRNHGATAIRFSSARSNSSKWALSAQEQEAAKNRRFGTVWLPAADNPHRPDLDQHGEGASCLSVRQGRLWPTPACATSVPG